MIYRVRHICIMTGKEPKCDANLSSSSIMFSSLRPPYTTNFFTLHTCIFSYLPKVTDHTTAGLASFNSKYYNIANPLRQQHIPIHYVAISNYQQQQIFKRCIAHSILNAPMQIIIQHYGQTTFILLKIILSRKSQNEMTGAYIMTFSAFTLLLGQLSSSLQPNWDVSTLFLSSICQYAVSIWTAHWLLLCHKDGVKLVSKHFMWLLHPPETSCLTFIAVTAY